MPTPSRLLQAPQKDLFLDPISQLRRIWSIMMVLKRAIATKAKLIKEINLLLKPHIANDLSPCREHQIA